MRCAVLCAAVLCAAVLCAVASADSYSSYNGYADEDYSDQRYEEDNRYGYEEDDYYVPSYAYSTVSYPAAHHVEEECDCSKYKYLGAGLGISSLLAFGALLLLQSQNSTGTARNHAGPGLIPRAAISLTCRTSELMSGKSNWLNLAEDMYGEIAQTEGVSDDFGLLRRGSRLLNKWHTFLDGNNEIDGATVGRSYSRNDKQAGKVFKTGINRFFFSNSDEGVKGRSHSGSECDCLPGLFGVLAGFGALGGVTGYSLYQSTQALRSALAAAAATTTTTTTTTTGRLLTPLEAVEDMTGLMFKLDLLAHMMNIVLGTEQQECQQYELCLLGQRAQDAGGTLGDLIPLASMPLSALMAQLSENTFSELCWAVRSGVNNGDCRVRFPHCRKSQRTRH